MMQEETKELRPLISKVRDRQNKKMLDIYVDPGEMKNAWFNHSVLCQTFFPYKNPKDATIHEHRQGNATLAVQCIKAMNPLTKTYEFVGLPWGAKARLILSYLNTQAIKKQSKIINIDDSLTGFVKSIGFYNPQKKDDPARYGPNGYTINGVKDQLQRIASSIISLGYSEDGKSLKQVNFGIVKGYEFWDLHDGQPTLWNSTIELTDDYVNSLLQHAIPLDERALCALANNAMALDIYAWLAQRLHRIPPGRPQFISWKDAKDQFGSNFERMDKFKATFRRNLKLAQGQYLSARIEEIINKGFNLSNSPSPISKAAILPTVK